jgi:hypothetical protein
MLEILHTWKLKLFKTLVLKQNILSFLETFAYYQAEKERLFLDFLFYHYVNNIIIIIYNRTFAFKEWLPKLMTLSRNRWMIF